MESNTELRREAEKEDNKMKRQNSILRNNVVFGKSIETPINKVDTKIGTTRKQYFKWSFRPTFERGKQFHNGAIAIEKGKYRINFNKPIYMEKSILDLSKALMQDFDYDYIKNKYGDEAEMLLTDTDTLMYKLKLKIL